MNRAAAGERQARCEGGGEFRVEVEWNAALDFGLGEGGAKLGHDRGVVGLDAVRSGGQGEGQRGGGTGSWVELRGRVEARMICDGAGEAGGEAGALVREGFAADFDQGPCPFVE